MGTENKKEPLPRFITSAAQLSQCPPEFTHEIAFIGRSNVGKSSLVAALLGQESLVRRSRTPGRTQLANYFESRDHQIYVDLPGYGYAEMPGKIKAKLDDLIEDYLSQREALACVLLLLDARREQPSKDDHAHYDFARAHGRCVRVVVTKIDRVAKAQRKPLYKKLETALGLAPGEIIAVSANEGDGLDALKKALRAEARA